MPTCEISGKDVPRTIRVRVEGVVMNVAPEYASMGKRMDPVIEKRAPAKKRVVRPVVKDEPVEVLVSDYGKRIKEARERRGLKQENLAKMMMEKVSLIHQVESGHMHPSDKLVAKFKQYLDVDSDDEFVSKSSSSSGMTLGDMFKDKLK